MTGLRGMVVWPTLLAVAGCAVAPLRDATQATAERVDAGAAVALDWPPEVEQAEAVPEFAEPMTLPVALATAFGRNPEIRRQYARLGIAHAELRDAARISNPTLSLAWLSPGGSGSDQTTQGISASFSDLLLLPSRRRLSATEYRRVELTVGSALVTLAREVEQAWYAEVGALQIAAMRAAVSDAARQEAELARRFHEAGNITQLQLDRQTAAAARAQIDALHAQAEASASRARLANLLGLPEAGNWRTVDRLAAPPDTPLSAEELGEQARSRRLDLAAAREEVALLEDARGVAGRWRLLGEVDVGYERERELDGAKIRGPTLALELPFFNQGQGTIERADAQLLDARARADALALGVENEVTTGARQLVLARDISERYRLEWLPAAASAVERQQERFNYMLVGAFDLVQAKRDQYDAWQGYFESLRDYWVARSELRAATGGLLPGDTDDLAPTAGPGDVVAPKEHHGDHHP